MSQPIEGDAERPVSELLDEILSHLSGGRLCSMGGVDDTRVFQISRATVERWHAERAALRGQGWRTMESAPRDGTFVYRLADAMLAAREVPADG